MKSFIRPVAAIAVTFGLASGVQAADDGERAYSNACKRVMDSQTTPDTPLDQSVLSFFSKMACGITDGVNDAIESADIPPMTPKDFQGNPITDFKIFDKECADILAREPNPNASVREQAQETMRKLNCVIYQGGRAVGILGERPAPQ